jgi:hypothetical protein
MITSKDAMSSTYANGISLWVINSTYKDIYGNSNSQQGAAIQCLNCRQLFVSGSVSQNIRS